MPELACTEPRRFLLYEKLKGAAMTETKTEASRKEVLSPEALAGYLRCGRTTAYALLADGTIPGFTIGRLRRVRRVVVDRYIAKRLGAENDFEEANV